MEFFQTSIVFASSESNNSLATGDFSAWLILFLLLLLVFGLCIFYYKKYNLGKKSPSTSANLGYFIHNKIIFYVALGAVALFSVILVSVSISSQLSFADSGKFNVSDKIEINIDNTDDVYSTSQSIDNQSEYTYCIDKVGLIFEEGIKDSSSWHITIDGCVVYDGEAGTEICLEEPVYVASKDKAVVEISSDINIDDAKKLGNKNFMVMNFAVCKLGIIQNMTVDDKSCPNDIDSNKIRFSWNILNDNTGFYQSSHEILVKKNTGEEIFDSGIVAGEFGAKTKDVSYEINKLVSTQDYIWELHSWDNFGNKLETSTSKFSTAYLEGDTPLGNAKFLSYDDPRLKKDDERHTQNFTIDYDLIMENTENSFCFGLLDNKNFYFLHLYKHGNNNLAGNFGEQVEGTGKSFGGFIFNGVSFNEQVKDKKIHVHIASILNNTNGVQSITPTISIGSEEEHVGVSFLPNYPIYLYKIGIFSNIERWNICNFISKITNIVLQNTNNNQEKEIYRNDFSSGRLGFYHEYTARLFQDDYGTNWIRVGSNVPDGNWVGEPLVEYNNEDGNFPVFRREFNIDKQIDSAKLYTSGLGAYDCFINGERVYNQTSSGDEYYELKNCYTQKDFSLFYLTHDITPMLNSGANAISAIVSDAWWSDKATNYWGKEDAFKCELIITYSDGTKDRLYTDASSWKTSASAPTYRAEIFSGESYDDNVDSSWKFASYDDSSWEFPKINTEQADVKLKAWKGEKITVRNDLERNVKSVSIYQGSSGAEPDVKYGHVNVVRTTTDNCFDLNPGETALIDFGQNASGWENFSAVSEAADTKITVKHAEILNVGDGEISMANFGPAGSASYYNIRSCYTTTELCLSQNKTCNYHPSFTYYGFRYIEITANHHVSISKLSASTLTSVKKDTSTFESSSPQINQLYSNAKWGMYSNYLGIPTDCPQRDERQGWTGDAQAFVNAGLILGDNKGFIEKFCQDMIDARKTSEGYLSFGSTAPEAGWGSQYLGAAGWADCGVILPYEVYKAYGDTTILETSWEAMNEYVRFWIPTQDSENHRGPTITLGDWHVPEQSILNRDEIKHVISCEYYLWDLQIMIDVSKILGKQSELTYYENQYQTIKAWFNNKYCSGPSLLYSESQTISAYAIYLDLIDNADVRDATANNLVGNIKALDNKLKTGFLGTRVLLDSLAKIGDYDLAYKVLRNEGNPSWLLSVNNGGTTFWERWDSYIEGWGYFHTADGTIDWSNSFNHYAYGGVVAWMYRNLLGINTDINAPGYKNIKLEPYPCIDNEGKVKLNRVKGSIASAYGDIFVDSNYSDNIWTYMFITPSNTSAVLKMPKLNFNTFMVNGIDFKELDFDKHGIKLVNEDDEFIEFEISNGTFEVSFSLN